MPRTVHGRALGASLAASLVVPLVIAAAPAASAAPPDSFSSSFESGDAAPLPSTVAQRDGAPWQQNVSDPGLLLPGSVTGQVTDVTASAENAPNEVAKNLTDGDPSTKWLTFDSTGWVEYTFAQPVSVSAYRLTSANDSDGRDPQDWTVEESADGQTWTPVDQRSGEDFPTRFDQRTFELASPAPAARYYRLNITQNSGDGLTQLADWDLSADLSAPATDAPMTTAVGDGPAEAQTSKPHVGFTGTHALHYAGRDVADGTAHAWNVLYDNVGVVVGPRTELDYDVFPELLNDLQYPSTYVAVDVRFTDGTYLSDLQARDSHGYAASPSGQGAAKILYADEWNAVHVDLGSVAAGKTVQQLLLGYDNPGGKAGTRFGGWLDDVSVAPAPPVLHPGSLTGYVDTRRGTNASGSFSRGLDIPAAAVPNGFNFWVPMTRANGDSFLYSYQQDNDDANKPVLQGLGISHEPSPWMGDRSQLAFMPSLVPADGAPDASLGARGLEFDHADETAQPDYYGVTFTDGVRAEVTPTDHGAVLRFTYPGDTGAVLVDKPGGGSSLTFDQATGTLSGWVDGGGAGGTRMYVAGVFDRTPTAAGTAAGDEPDARYATFDTSSQHSVELRVATSFIGQDQAKHNLDLEVAGRTFDQVRAAATSAWQKRLGVIDVSGATQDQLVTLYSNLYRLNLYPNSEFENAGTVAKPQYEYASPVSPTSGAPTDTATNAKIVPGTMYVNNGFWDTYRAAWPAYSLLYPDVAAKLVDGFVQQYRDGGWISRWSSPGYADMMTGTSSDVAFADAYLRGALPTSLALDAYDAALKNATVAPPTSAVGRKGLSSSIFLGYTPATTTESVSWGLEGMINDFGIGNMAKKLADDPATPDARRAQLRDESAYFLARATDYPALFDPSVGFFQGKNADGTFVSSAKDFDPTVWGDPYTETDAWGFAFHAPQDPQGLADLYGGTKGLEAKLDAYFATPELANTDQGHKEPFEARAVRMGQWSISNQVSFHVPWLYDAAGAPAKAQSTIREALQRLFAGSEIGQGYPGDEDNGAMSAWWVFAALGFYPVQSGSDQYAVGSPLFQHATVHLPSGDLVVDAKNDSVDNVYVQSLTVNGKKHSSTSLSQADLTGGSTLSFVMGPKPSSWGTGKKDGLPSLTTGDQAPTPLADVTKSGLGTVTVSDGGAKTDPRPLTDDTSNTRATFATTTPQVTWTSTGIAPVVASYTLTSGAAGTAAPTGWTLQGSNDGKRWTTLDERSGQTFPWQLQTRVFSVAHPKAFVRYRITVTGTKGTGALSLAEVELLADHTKPQGSAVTLTASDDRETSTGQAVTGTFATIAGADDRTDVQVTFGDGSAPVAGTLAAGSLGTSTVRASHTWSAPGVYPVTVTATAAGRRPVSATSLVTVDLVREGSLAAQLDAVCISDAGTEVGHCDLSGSSFDRAQLAATGFAPGKALTVPGTALTFELVTVRPGEPDSAEGEGQTVQLDLPADATHLSVIGTSTEGDEQSQGVLTFDDGTTQPIDLSFGDWVGHADTPAFGNIVVARTGARLGGGSPQDGTPAAIFATAPLQLPAGKHAVSLTLPGQPGVAPGGGIHVFAIASDGAATRAPVAVTAADAVTLVAGQSAATALAHATGGRAGDTLHAAVTWGDGSDVVAGTVGADGSVTGAHTYATAGTYTAHVVVDDGWTSAVVAVPVTVTAP